jgi:hypothetical protein
MGPYVKQSLALFPSHLRVGIAQNEANSGEKITLSRTIAADNDIVFWGKGFDDRLVFVTIERAR